MNPFVVEKLLATGMADPVVGGEDHNGLIKNSFRAQTLENVTDLLVGIANGVEVARPIVQDHWVSGIVRRKPHYLGRSERAESAPHRLGPVLPLSVFATVQLNLHEERLARRAAGPVIAVVKGRRPLEVVIGLRQRGPFDEWAANRGVIARAAEKSGNRLYAFRQMDLLDSAAAPVVLRRSSFDTSP